MSDHTASRSALAEAQRERARQAESEADRLKVENASLLGSLREAKLDRDGGRRVAEAQRERAWKAECSLAAAEQRAEAAEKRASMAEEQAQRAQDRVRLFQKALRAACGQLDRAAADIWSRNHGSLDQFARHLDSIADQARAALHDEAAQ